MRLRYRTRQVLQPEHSLLKLDLSPHWSFSWLRRGLLSLLICATVPFLQAQTWPAKPVKFIVPFPPGGSVDALARLFASRLNDSLNQSFIVENKPGASGSVGSAVVAKSPADGYTFLFVFDTHAVNPSLLVNLPYDTLKDFSPVVLIGTAPIALATPGQKPYQKIADLVSAAKLKPGSIAYGTVGNGSLGHLTISLAEQSGNFKLNHIPYKGGAQVLSDALGAQIDLAVVSVAVLTPYLKSGKLRVLAVTGDKRSPLLPEVPTLAEAGFANQQGQAWWGVFAPAHTPRAIVQRLNDELNKLLSDPLLRKHLVDGQGMEIVGGTPEVLQKWTDTEIKRWATVVRDNRIQLD